jgi:hypothetical protein
MLPGKGLSHRTGRHEGEARGGLPVYTQFSVRSSRPFFRCPILPAREVLKAERPA